MCMRIFARIWAFLHTRWIKLLPERLTLHCTRCSWTWRSRCQEHVEFAYYCMLVWGRWLKFAAFVLVQKRQCVIRSSCRNGRWSCLCAICVALCKSAYASAKEEKTASSIVQFECVSLLVRLTCHRSYPTSHSFTLKTVRILEWRFGRWPSSETLVFFSVRSLDHMQRAIQQCRVCDFAMCCMQWCFGACISCVFICISGRQRIKKIIQNKKTIRPTESSFQGLRDRKQGLFLYRPNQVFFFFPNLGLLRALRWKRPLVVCWTLPWLLSHGELAPPKILEKKEEVPRWNPQCRTLGQDRWVPRRRGFIRSLGFSCLRRNAFIEAATWTPPAKQRRVSTSRA